MSKKANQRRRQQAKYEKEKATIDNFHQMAPKLKPVLRQVGCDLPFYDFLDSYAEEFCRTVASAMRECQSLIGIHEVDEAEFRHVKWANFGAGTYQQVLFKIDERFSGYGTRHNSDANIRGSTTFFLDEAGTLRTLVLIPRNPNCLFQHKELKYAFKIAALLHELGHVQDAEQRRNIDPTTSRFELVEAEAYANCHALDRLADRCLAQTYSLLYEGMQAFAAASGYEAEIGRLVLDRHQRRQIEKWQHFMEAAKRKAAIRW